VNFEQHAFRWLGKALSAYGPEGALTDVVNLTFAMLGQDFNDLTDIQVADKIRALKRKIETKDLGDLWIPNYFFMDAECDDCLVWALLQYVSQLNGTASEFKVLIQLPEDPVLDPLAHKWSKQHNCEVWRDPGSRNGKALTQCHIDQKADRATSGAAINQAPRSLGNQHQSVDLERTSTGMTSSSASNVRVFWSGHLTLGHQKRRQDWLSPHAEGHADVRASMPPFNNANKMALPPWLKVYDVPAFGPHISEAVMDIFEMDEIKHAAASVNVPIPRRILSKPIQEKMVKVLDMIRHCQETPDIKRENATATNKLKVFVEEFQALRQDSIKNVKDWEEFVDKHARPGWQAKTHFDHLLDNFGFQKEASDLLRKTEFVKADGETVTFERHAFRWLGKALCAYGPEGAVTDVVNLASAMTGQDFTVFTDIQVAEKIRELKGKIESKDLSDLWIPNYFFMDAESDDCLCWALLQHVSKLNGTASELKVLIQLPGNPEFDPLAQEWSRKQNCEVWRDLDSRNGPALTQYHMGLKSRSVLAQALGSNGGLTTLWLDGDLLTGEAIGEVLMSNSTFEVLALAGSVSQTVISSMERALTESAKSKLQTIHLTSYETVKSDKLIVQSLLKMQSALTARGKFIDIKIGD